jgi:hypothetical protein
MSQELTDYEELHRQKVFRYYNWLKKQASDIDDIQALDFATKMVIGEYLGDIRDNLGTLVQLKEDE